MTTYTDIITKLDEVYNETEYAYIGIRTQEEPFELGPIDHKSRCWFGREDDVEDMDDMPELDGLSVTIYNPSMLHDMKGHVEGGCYYREGGHTAIIGFNDYSMGDDAGEAVAEDPEVLYVF